MSSRRVVRPASRSTLAVLKSMGISEEEAKLRGIIMNDAEIARFELRGRKIRAILAKSRG